MRQTILAVLALGAATLLSCKSVSAPSEPAPAPIPTPRAADPLAAAIVQDLRYQPDVKMGVMAQGDRLVVRMVSDTDEEVWVNAGKFGVILKGERQVRWFNPERDGSKFPPVKMGKGEVITGQLQFNGLGNLAGHKLIFKHDEQDKVRPSVAPILDEQGRSRELGMKKPPRPAPMPANAEPIQ